MRLHVVLLTTRIRLSVHAQEPAHAGSATARGRGRLRRHRACTAPGPMHMKRLLLVVVVWCSACDILKKPPIDLPLAGGSGGSGGTGGAGGSGGSAGGAMSTKPPDLGLLVNLFGAV